MNSARGDILKRIDQAKFGMNSATPLRTYETSTALSPTELLDLLEDRILDYKASFIRTSSVGLAIAEIVTTHNLKTIVVPSDLPKDWLTPNLQTLVDSNFDANRLDQMDAVITASEIAIAVTGTIILNHAKSDQGRRAISLVPDSHICIVKVANVVGTVVEAVRMLNPRDHQTWISGPSATSDIELERVEGVHGPRNLHVILDLS